MLAEEDKQTYIYEMNSKDIRVFSICRLTQHSMVDFAYHPIENGTHIGLIFSKQRYKVQIFNVASLLL